MNKAAIAAIPNELVKDEVQVIFNRKEFYFAPANAAFLQQKIMNATNLAKSLGDVYCVEYLETKIFSSVIIRGKVAENRTASTGLTRTRMKLGGFAKKSLSGGCAGAGCDDEVKNPKPGQSSKNAKKKVYLSFKDKLTKESVIDVDNISDTRTIFEVVADYNGDATKCVSVEEVEIIFGYKSEGVTIPKVITNMKAHLIALGEKTKEELKSVSKTKKGMRELAGLIFSFS